MGYGAKYERYLALLMVAACLLQGAVFAAAVPAWRAPDEPGYFGEIRSLADEGRLSSLTGHPPLYPVLGAVPYLVGPNLKTKIFFVRLMGALFNGVTVWFIYKVAAEVFGEKRLAALLPPAVTAFNMQFNFIGAFVNSDSLLTMVSAIFFYLAMRSMMKSVNLKMGIALAAVAVLGMLSKQRFVVLLPLYLPVLAVGILGRIDLDKKRRRLDAPKAVFWSFIGALVAAMAGFIIYITTKLIPTAFPSLSLLFSIRSVWSILGTPSFLAKLFFEFWGYFDWLSLPMRNGTYAYFAVLTLLSGIGLVVAAARRIKRSGLRGFISDRKAIYWAVMLAGLALAIYAVAVYSIQTDGGAQGRYLFVVAAPIAVSIGRGLAELAGDRFWRPVLGLVVVSLLAVDYLEIVYRVLPYYY